MVTEEEAKELLGRELKDKDYPLDTLLTEAQKKELAGGEKPKRTPKKKPDKKEEAMEEANDTIAAIGG